MNVVGIVAEFDPFHAGHRHLVEETRRHTGAETVVAVMSGDFTQRGEPAAFNKHARAEMAVRGGVSLVLELPLPGCISSAQGFARAGVGLLAATGAVSALAFGSECADIDLLKSAAAAVEQEKSVQSMHRYLDAGLSYAAAREQALRDSCGEAAASVLRSPNDTLAVEYIRAAGELMPSPEFLAVPRKGSGHNGAASASDIRTRLFRGENVAGLVPVSTQEILRRETDAGKGPVTPAALDSALLSRLRFISKEELARTPGVSEGLENRLYDALRREPSLSAAIRSAQSTRYPLSRIRRAFLSAALGITKETAGLPPACLRVLAADEKGLELIRTMEHTALLPLLLRPGDVRSLPESCQRSVELGSAARDLYVLGYPGEECRRGDSDFQTPPCIIK